MIKQITQVVFRKTLNSVIFGIAIMVLIAAYIAIGSGVVSVREYFEMNELQFFSAWPLKVLMVLLIANLIVVTWTRIPLTAPRYGVWCIHLGIITLILGMAGYYANKVEGTVRLEKGGKADYFYDTAERSLFVKLNGQWVDSVPLTALPRFAEYSGDLRNAGRLDRTSLRGIQPGMTVRDEATGKPKRLQFNDAYAWKDPLKIDIVGYWPYAGIQTSFGTDESSKDVGLRLALTDPHGGDPRETWLIAGDPRHKSRTIGEAGVEVEHRNHDDANIVAGLKTAAAQLLSLTFTVGDKKGQTFVEVGKSYPLAETGYTVKIESYNPAWPMFGSGEMVKAMTLMVKSPSMEYRRMILDGKPLQTDFKLNEAGAGPMGKRQKEPLDKSLQLDLLVADPFHLFPSEASTKHTFVTGPDNTLADIKVSLEGPTEITEMKDGRGQVPIVIQHDHGDGSGPMRGPFQPPDPQNDATAPTTDDGDHKATLSVARVDKIIKEENVNVPPKSRRESDPGGLMQVLQAKLTMGSWSKTVLVPYTYEAGEPKTEWTSTIVKLPDTSSTIQLALCNTRLHLPATLTLQNFELVPYPGGDKTLRSAFRDYRSTLIVEDADTETSETAVAHMNNPVYFGGGRWLFFQAGYDPDNQAFTILGVGNRPCVWVMTLGCVMIFVGLMYAFYLKPIIIRRMKAKALAAAAARPKKEIIKEPEMVGV